MAGRNFLVNSNFLIRTVSCRGYSAAADKNVAFLGLGNMGQHMAANLVKKGFKVTGFDASKEAMKSAASSGITAGGSLASTVEGATVVVTCLPNNQIVKDVYTGAKGVIDSACKDALLIDSSTVDPSVSREVWTKTQEKGLSFIDAPVSGGVMGAQNATLAFMVGGDIKNMERARPLLAAMGAKQFHCGQVGSGQIAKLCNNMLMAINVLGTSECMNMAIEMGLDPKTFHDILNCSTGRSWATEVYCPVPDLLPNAPSTKKYDGGFKNDLMVKDLLLASSMAVSSGSPIPLGAASTQLYRMIQARGFGGKDFSFIYQILKGL